MSDEYGFQATAVSALQLFEIASRGCGRTSRMIERVADGDLIIVATGEEQRRVRKLLTEAGKPDVRVVAADRGMPHSRATGRVFFDHSWVLAHFTSAVEDAGRWMQRYADEIGGTKSQPVTAEWHGAGRVNEFARKRGGAGR